MRMAILAGLVVLLAGCGADEAASLSGPRDLRARRRARRAGATGWWCSRTAARR